MTHTLALALTLTTLATAADDLEQRITAIAAKAPATFGVAALDLETGRRVALRGDERFPMGSVFKFPVALAFLHRVDAGESCLSTAWLR
jgi:beta-lactamase class A